jgi:AmmeMemoRadiSam system protein A
MLQLSEGDQHLLLRVARNAVASHLSQIPLMNIENPSGVLAEPHPVFVSIHKGSALRGCIGNILPSLPLYRSAAECAVSAAIADPRFRAMSSEELPDVRFEISVLSEMEAVRNIEDIVVGVHGLLICRGNARGILLPQVASSQGWDRNRFFNEVCQKAGIPPDDLKDSTIQRFSALVFDEHMSLFASTS